MYQTYERTSTLAPSIASALQGVYTKWEMSGRAEDGQVLRNMVDLYASAFKESGTFPRYVHVNIATGEGYPVEDPETWSYFFFETFGCQHTLCELATLLDHEVLSDALVRYAHFRFKPGNDEREPGLSPAVAQAFAWLHAGDQACLDQLQAAMDADGMELHTIGGTGVDEEPVHTVPVERLRRNKFGCHLGNYLHLAPFALRALEEAKVQSGSR